MAKFGRILVVRGGAIGDFILTLPVLDALRENYPNALVGCLAPAGLGELALTAGLADEIQDLDGREWAGFFVSEWSLDPNMVKWLSQKQKIQPTHAHPSLAFHQPDPQSAPVPQALLVLSSRQAHWDSFPLKRREPAG
jgi:heptosyltransferase-2